MLIVSSVQSSWVPIKFQIHRDHGAESKVIFKDIISIYISLIAIAFLFSLFIFPEIIILILDSKYYESANLIPYVLLIPFFKAIYYKAGTGFEFTDNTKPIPLISLLGLLSLVIFSFLFIESAGIIGLIISISISWIVMASAVRYFSISRFYIPLDNRLLVLIISMIIISVLLYVNFQNLNNNMRFILLFILVLTSGLLINLFINNKYLKSYIYNNQALLFLKF